MATITQKVVIPVEVEGADKAVKDLNKVTEATEEQGETLLDVAANTKIFGVSINSLREGLSNSIRVLRTSITSLKSFKVALAATGIGLIVVALGSFVAFLTQTQKGADLLSDSLKVLGTIVNVLVNRVASLGSALVKAFTGDFKGALEDTKAAFTGINEQLREAVQNTLALEEASRRLELQQQAAITTVAAQRASIQELLFVSRDLINETSQTRLNALRQAALLQEELNRTAQAVADEQLRIAQETANQQRLEQGEVTREQQRVLREAEENAINVRSRGLAQLRELRNRIVTETNTFNKEQAERARLANQEQVNITIEANDEILEDTRQTGIQINETYRDNTENYRKEQEIRTSIAQQQAEKRANIIAAAGELLGQFGKEGAIAQAIINTYQGATKALAQGGAFGYISAAAVVAAGLKSVQRIISTPLPTFSQGGLIGGNLHSQGGTIIEAERGEYIINRRSMQNPAIAEIAQALNGFQQSKGLHFQQGGFVPQQNFLSVAELNNVLSRLPRQVLVTEDLDRVQNRVNVTESRATL